MKAYKIAFSGISSALCVIIMFMTGIFPALSIVLPMTAGLIVLITSSELSINWALLTYISTSILSLIITFDKEAVLIFIMFFGYYPVLRFIINNIKSKKIRWILKFLVFNTAIFFFFIFTTYILKITAFLEEIKSIGKYGIPAILGMANLTFVLYEYNLDIFYEIYNRRIKPVLKIGKP